ncbi:MAG: AAA family ATPase [Polyangiaceae bacterium]|nr:AAA family ATPase [Polyangiaceae bacterium]
MAKLAELSKLFHAISARDWRVAQELALEVAEAEATRGNHAAATRLRGALKPNGTRNGAPNNGPTVEAAGAVGILTELPPLRGLGSVSLRQRQRAELQTLLKEWRLRDRLQQHGVRRRSKILFYGPPGCGKSMAARAIAHEASLPAYVVQLDAVMGAFLGQTALRVRELFRFAEAAPSVLLLDEVDALGRERGNAMDVGELDRVVISVMQHLEHSEPAGFLIATSNLPSHLDPALVRRFDLKLEFPAPTKAERTRFGTEIARAHGVTLTQRLKAEFDGARAFADIERLVSDEKRRKLLNGG